MVTKQNIVFGVFLTFALVAVVFFGVSVFRQPAGPLRPQVTSDDPYLGKSNAHVTIVVFSDFQCEFCKADVPTLKSVLAQFQDQVKLVHKDFPLPVHASARRAAEIARCAQDQGKFWQMYDALFNHQFELPTVALETLATESQVDVQALKTCLESSGGKARVDASIAEAQRLNITEVPVTFVNNQRITGIVDAATLQRTIQGQL
jgi:protein-disulfide isomerase